MGFVVGDLLDGEMALCQSISFPALNKHQFIGTSQNRKLFILPTTETSRYRLVSSLHTARSKPCSPLRTISCVAGANSDDGIREASSPSTSIFVKDSVSEGRLKRVFSEFGRVSNVKIIVNERTRQSLGYGYVWFNSKEDAQLAVEAMNGKFFDGRFILVKFGQPGLSRRRKPHSDFLFVNKRS
ncbi:PREDICTED: U11/U12 small nuclear ribonucleoprotein 31 kDa protein-like isoform X2 [Camelina sativa]|uniref:U11/U12 small nuclear ribonucleoprotein 31 kDa protein-like isoform X2 n=1 Tax=Camelina sativa TaxID=90675 RepID=A0ABM0VCJ2_CAMSA|nr:PREDICTED: U11/U12 small nuclear ribonucleoprotein 31 kDa protein-like isoform X2 [Camelina sativa]